MLPRYLSSKWKNWIALDQLADDHWRIGHLDVSARQRAATRLRWAVFTLAKWIYSVLMAPFWAVRIPINLVSLGMEIELLHSWPRRQITCGNGCVIDRQTWLVQGSSIRLGDHVKISAFSVLMAGQRAKIEIGDYTIIGPNVLICSVNHGFAAADVPIRYQKWKDDPETGIAIGENVWIGGNVVILPGTRIGNGSIIGAGSVVRGDVPPNTIYVEDRRPKILDRQNVRRKA